MSGDYDYGSGGDMPSDGLYGFTGFQAGIKSRDTPSEPDFSTLLTSQAALRPPGPSDSDPIGFAATNLSAGIVEPKPAEPLFESPSSYQIDRPASMLQKSLIDQIEEMRYHRRPWFESSADSDKARLFIEWGLDLLQGDFINNLLSASNAPNDEIARKILRKGGLEEVAPDNICGLRILNIKPNDTTFLDSKPGGLTVIRPDRYHHAVFLTSTGLYDVTTEGNGDIISRSGRSETLRRNGASAAESADRILTRKILGLLKYWDSKPDLRSQLDNEIRDIPAIPVRKIYFDGNQGKDKVVYQPTNAPCDLSTVIEVWQSLGFLSKVRYRQKGST